MPDARTYRQFAEECLRLVKSMPQHRAMLEEMAATWQRLASAADEKQTKGGKKKDEG
jgi:ferric-dicitrate binding protein FerR (iron transport regulator)